MQGTGGRRFGPLCPPSPPSSKKKITYHCDPLMSVPLPWIAGSKYTPYYLLILTLSTENTSKEASSDTIFYR